MRRLATTLVLALITACTGTPATSSNPPTTPSAPQATSTAPSSAAGAAAACPAIRQISLGAVSGTFNYPQGLQNHPSFPIVLVKVDDLNVSRSLHVQPGVDPSAPRAFTITAVEPGTYVAVGYLTPEYLAAFTPAVACGLGASCTDHSLTQITVRAGETTSGADVRDWSVPRANVPPRPAGSLEHSTGDAVRVCNPYADSANMRASAGLGFPVRQTLDNGVALAVRAGPLAADGYDWYEVNRAGDQLASGWVVAYALRK